METKSVFYFTTFFIIPAMHDEVFVPRIMYYFNEYSS